MLLMTTHHGSKPYCDSDVILLLGIVWIAAHQRWLFLMHISEMFGSDFLYGFFFLLLDR